MHHLSTWKLVVLFAAPLVSVLAVTEGARAAGARAAAAPASSAAATAPLSSSAPGAAAKPPKSNDDVAVACQQSFTQAPKDRLAALSSAEADLASLATAAGGTPPWPDCEGAAKDVCARAARRPMGDALRNRVFTKDGAKVCMNILSGTTAGAATDVGGAILQSIAQVVATKAEAAGWELLLDSIKDAAHCSASDTLFPDTCKVLATLNIKDLVSSPGVLLTALVTDLMAQVKNSTAKAALTDSAPIIGDAIIDATTRWAQSGAPGIVQALRNDLTLRRELLDHVIVLGERHLLPLVRRHASYYNEDHPHMSLDGDAPVARAVEPRELGKVVALPRVSGLHHRYVRRAA